MRPLEGIRVADFSWWWAGPYCTLLMALAGAEVVRVETMRSLDPIRRTRARPAADGAQGDPGVNRSPSFNSMNLNKKSVRLDLRRPEAAALARELVKVSDVVVENSRPGTMEKFGLGYEDLRAIKPDILMVSVSGMGQKGPEKHYSGFAANFGALSGMSYLTTYADGIPTEMRGQMDLITGATACFAVLSALYHRHLTGEGQYIDLAAGEAIATFLGDVMLDYPLNGRNPEPRGNRHPFLAPHGVYPCRDEDSWITIAVGSDAEWRAFCKVMERPDLLRDARFCDAPARWQQQDALDAEIAAWTKGYSDIELMDRLQAVGLAATASYTTKELGEDPHLQARGMYQEVDHPELGRQIVLGPPFQLPEAPLQILRAGPLLGEHNREVFCELLGRSDAELVRLIREEIVY